MVAARSLYEEDGWPTGANALSDPTQVVYYFGAFRDNQGRKLIGVKRAAQFKGTVKKRLVSLLDDTPRMVSNKTFRLEDDFDFLITCGHVFILRPDGFERVGEIEAMASAKAKTMASNLSNSIKFLDFAGLANFVATHKRGARLVVALSHRTDLGSISRAKFCKAAKESDVKLQTVGRKLAPIAGHEIGCLQLLDDRRYTTALVKGKTRAFVANSRRPV